MAVKPAIPREVAAGDIEDAIAYYLHEAGVELALGLIDDIEAAFAHLSHHPATGSSRYAHELNLPGLKTWPLARYPFLVFYFEQADYIDIWRVLHTSRDIPAWMQGD